MSAILSCKKETISDTSQNNDSNNNTNNNNPNNCTQTDTLTIKPLPYYPAFPGSYWKYYRSYFNDTTITKVDSVYKLHRFYECNNGCDSTPWVYVPFIGSEPIYGYAKPQVSVSQTNYMNYCQKLYPFLRETYGWIATGYTLFSNHSNHEYYVSDFIDTLTVQNNLYNDIIEVTYHFKNDFTILSESKIYYAKNVGLIKSIVTYQVQAPQLVGATMELIEYKVTIEKPEMYPNGFIPE